MTGELPSTNSLFKTTINMAWPSMVESFLVALVGFIDTIMVSTLGSYAIAAVGLTQQPKFIGLALFMSMRPEPCSVSAADTAASPRETATGPSLFPRAARTPAENSSAAASTAAEDRVKPLTSGASLAFFDVAFRWYGLYNLCYIEPSLHTMITYYSGD